MKILLITDIHHGTNANYKKHKGEDYKNIFGEEFRGKSERLAKEMNQCDLVVNLGDLIQDENRDTDLIAYKEAVNLFTTKSPIKHVVGNHDLRNLSIADITTILRRDKEYTSFDLNNFHHVILGGTRKEPRGPHYIDEEQLKWLEKDLANTNLSTLVYCHYPLDNQDFSENYYFKNRPDGGSLGNRGFVRPMLEKSNIVKAVFSGHTHFFHKEIIKNIIYCTVPSFSENNGDGKPNHQFALVEVNDNDVNIEIKNLNN
jgi:predicted phosphodiesterase